jgi:ubiquinone/menaquinone biosynthesis C-methylase UbiE
MRMVDHQPNRHIIATTIDHEGLEFAAKLIAENGLSDQIACKLENVAEPLAHPDSSFDFIYARLVLHYLPKQQLVPALSELYRVLKPGGRIFVVVRSTECPEPQQPDSVHDKITGLTRYRSYGGDWPQRYFHTPESIRGYVEQAGFALSHIQAYPETLYLDFRRTHPQPQPDHVIELIAEKPLAKRGNN